MSARREPKQWNIARNRTGAFYIDGIDSEACLLIHRYAAGDVDLIDRDGPELHGALYDLFQVSDELAEGDTFALDGKPLYRCEGVHVVKLEPVA